MAVGLITSPVTWLLGTVAPPAWFQTVQDNSNAWYTSTTVVGTKQKWVPGLSFSSPAGIPNITNGRLTISSGATFAVAGLNLVLPASGGALAPVLTTVEVYLTQTATTARTCQLLRSSPVSGTADVIVSSTATPAANGIQVATMNSIVESIDSTHTLWILVQSLATGEQVNGARITYTSAVG